jgi:uncharacterized GH25 family protein
MGITQRGSITLEVLLRGKPAARKTVTVIGQMASKSSAQDLKTDEKGRVKVSLGPADAYLARVKFDEENRESSGQFEKRSYEATYVFQVFNGL